ncbi:MAG: CDP-glycerol glycerophosphotransferase family protein [Deferribacteres bacterium]|nr:CDP-glycerol glycerophosphotransferase family protein [candidate division KSB1 bacterium]MCB9503059.1 CDP-glycerol glycerophosphotransferase family protein [Deferribacteres bacterium]
MPPVYYFANQIYQFSHALPLYKLAGGTFICRDVKRYIHFKKYFRNMDASPQSSTLFHTPPSIFRNRKKLTNLKGVIVSLANTVLSYDKNACSSIFLGHGTGDKPYGGSSDRLLSYDYHFITGDKHMQKLLDSNVKIPDERLIKIGNLRFDDYVNGKFDREVEADRLGIVDRTRKNVLYAPTWSWGDGTLLKYVYRFAQEITERYNLIIRPHYYDSKTLVKISTWAKKNRIKHVYFSNPATLLKSDTMADFIVSDILISDTSSILYEYLITGNPIIVATNDYKDLHNMPSEMDILQHVPLFSGSENIVTMIEESLADANYKKTLNDMLHSCFYFNDGRAVERAMNFIESAF